MNNLQCFNFQGLDIQAVNIDDSVWFVAKDVCNALDLDNNRQALARLDDDEKGVTKVDTLGK